MKGQFKAVWEKTWNEIWWPLSKHDEAPEDLFCELFREISKSLFSTLRPEQLADIIDNKLQAKETFQNLSSSEVRSERAIVFFLESTHDVLSEVSDPLAEYYVVLLKSFIENYSLRYDFLNNKTLCPTIPGIFSSLFIELKTLTQMDPHLSELTTEFDAAIKELRLGITESKIKICISKQMNLLEALGSKLPGVTGNTLGAICNQANTWPHDKVKEGIQNLYKFASDYPGIRHGGNSASANRTIQLRDLIAVTVLLVGYTPYLSEQFDLEKIYDGN